MTLENPTLRQRLFKYYWYFKLMYGRAHNYIDVPQSAFMFVGVVMIWMKLFLGSINNLVFTLVIIGFFIVYMAIGYLDVKWGIIKEEVSFNNQFNPELTHLVKQTKKKVKI